MEKVKEALGTKKTKRFTTILLFVALIGWVVFRFAVVAEENSRHVFNASRVAIEHGTPVHAITVERKEGVLREPVSVKNNRALVSGARASKLRPGQKIGDGKIVSVSSNIDWDSGMHVVRTSGVSDGLQYAQYSATGYFVPVYAVLDNTVMVVDNGVASARTVTVSQQDSENAYITNGLRDGDIVILSHVDQGQRVQVVK